MSAAPARPAEPTDATEKCGVCAHLLADHDRVGLRYCRATQAQALPRGCICRAT